jgi:hypothetical protein
VGILYVAAAFAVVPGILVMFHRLSRVQVTSQAVPGRAGPPAVEPGVRDGHALAEEAQRWLESQA